MNPFNDPTMINQLANPGTSDGITFRVADVEPADLPLDSVKTKEAVEVLLKRSVEATSDYTDNCVARVTSNPLVYAAKLAHCQHRPLVLSPDAIWLTICQGLAIQIDRKWDEFQHKIVRSGVPLHRVIEVSLDDFPFGSAESSWGELIGEVCDTVRLRIEQSFTELFTKSFSTTTFASRVALDIAFLSAVNRTFTIYPEAYICGIPSITLRGTVHDWERIQEGIDEFENYGLGLWASRLRPILAQFVSASKGDIDRQFWSSLFTDSEGSSFCKDIEIVTGWISLLFPFLEYGKCHRVNPALTGEEGANVTLSAFPSGITKIAMRSQHGSWVNLIGGLIAICQNQETCELEPKIGWAVQRMNKIELLLERAAESVNCSGDPAHAYTLRVRTDCPNLKKFYQRFAGLIISDCSGNEFCKFIDPYHYKLRSPANNVFEIAKLANGDWLGVTSVRQNERIVPQFFAGTKFPNTETESLGFLTVDFSDLLEAALDAADTNRSITDCLPIQRKITPLR